MKVWVYVDRKKAILAGKNEAGWKLVEVDMGKLSQEEREYVAERDNIRHDSNTSAQEIGGSVAEATEDATIQCIREEIATQKRKEEERKRNREEQIQKLLGKKIEEYIYPSRVVYRGREMNGYYYSTDNELRSDDRIAKLYAQIEAEVDRRNEVVYQEELRKEAEEKAKKAEKAREEEVKREQIRKWVAEKGTENQKKRYEIGLLPESEVVDAIREEAYAALVVFPRYEKMNASDVCVCEGKYDYETGHPISCDVDFEVRKATEATAYEYETMEKIAETVKKARPDATITMIDHIGTSEDCENEVIRKSVKVEIVVGAFKFSREYAI